MDEFYRRDESVSGLAGCLSLLLVGVFYIYRNINLYRTGSEHLVDLILSLCLTPFVAFLGTCVIGGAVILGYLLLWFVVAKPLSCILRLMNLPKRGTLGTAGLALAVISFLLTIRSRWFS
jgi:hypothetical protein